LAYLGQAVLVGAQTDITDRKLAEARLHYNALHDSLTGLPNRALFLDRLGQVIKRRREGNTPAFALLFLDLDRFKTINDSLGHQAGDELLIGVARRLEGCLRPGDTVARLSGDEFTILLEPLIQATEATARAEQIQRALAPPFPVQGQEIFVSASIGIGLGTGEYRHADDVLRAADAALHQAKLWGKARYAVFAAPIYDQARSRLQLETDLHRAVARTEFRLHYQPIVLLANDLTVGFEALVRWHHPTRGLLAPGDFLPLAEDTGLITPLSYWVLREACRQLVEWQRQLAPLPPLSISVNLPAGLLTQPELVPRIRQILRETSLAAPQLKLELVENTLVAEGEAAATALGRLKILGVQLSIDDFGTGYSSLSYLHRFPVDTIKIDRSFVSRLGTDHEPAEIIAAIVTLARSLGMTTVGEGIETAEQQQQLQALGCDYGQGWLFAPALDAAQTATLLAGLRTTRPGSPPAQDAALLPPLPPGIH
jgi:diguanylate cyclase (GGDEF)-like protein